MARIREGGMMEGKRERGAFMKAHTAPGLLFACGALVFPSFLLQQDLAVRAAQVVLYVGLCAFSGRHVRPLQYLVVAAGIVVFNLVIPTGRVLLSVFGLPLTEGALKSGLLKATAMTGLIALSQFSIRSDLRIPGRIGGLLGRSLFYFERIMGQQRKVERKDIIGSIDALLLEVHQAPVANEEALLAAAGGRGGTRRKSTPRGYAFLAAVVLVNWGAFVAAFFHLRLF
jgi:hypothetical protein